jgi:hypothetical protein
VDDPLCLPSEIGRLGWRRIDTDNL